METVPKWWASSGAVATVAAIVIARPSASSRSAARRADPGGLGSSSAAARASTRPSGTPSSRMPATAANESCQPGSPQARGFQASVSVAASSSAYQRDAGREPAIAASPARPMIPARWSDGPAPASGT